MAEHAHTTPTRTLVPTRRTILAGLSGAAFAGACLAAVVPDDADHPDAELLAACAHYERLEADYRAACDADPEDLIEDHAPAGYTEAWDTLADIPALTFEGAKAKAHAIGVMHEPDYQEGDAVTWSLVRDVMRLAGAA